MQCEQLADRLTHREISGKLPAMDEADMPMMRYDRVESTH